MDFWSNERRKKTKKKSGPNDTTTVTAHHIYIVWLMLQLIRFVCTISLFHVRFLLYRSLTHHIHSVNVCALCVCRFFNSSSLSMRLDDVFLCYMLPFIKQYRKKCTHIKTRHFRMFSFMIQHALSVIHGSYLHLIGYLRCCC